MKKYYFAFFVVFTIAIGAHSQTMVGTYTNTWKSNADGALTYTLTLNPDGTFLFESTREYETSIPSKTIEAKGTWKSNYRLLKLYTETSTQDNDLVEGLNNNKARFKSYPPRHRKYKKVKPSLKFYKSKVFYAKGMELLKTESKTVMVSN